MSTTRYQVKRGYSLMEDEGREPEVWAAFDTLQEAEAYRDEQLEKHGSWGACVIEEVKRL